MTQAPGAAHRSPTRHPRRPPPPAPMALSASSQEYAPHPWVPKQLREHHQVSRGEGEAHVGGGDGQHGHGGPLRQLELLAQVLTVGRGGGAIDADVLHTLREQEREARWAQVRGLGGTAPGTQPRAALAPSRVEHQARHSVLLSELLSWSFLSFHN